MAAFESAVVLLSGGLDSATLLAMVQARGLKVHALSFDYSQRHLLELQSARQIVRYFGLPEERHHIVKLDASAFKGSALTDDIEVPKHRSDLHQEDSIPSTYVPARNTIFLSFALAFSEILQANHIFIGVNALDYSGYPDCRPAYIEAFKNLAKLATSGAVSGKQSIQIEAPLIALSKADIIRKGIELGVDYSMTLSCYDPDATGAACGGCDACLLRAQGFKDAAVSDPTRYVKGVSLL